MIVKAISHHQAKRSAIKALIDYIYDPQKMEDPYHKREPLIMKQYLPTYHKDKWADTLFENFSKKTYTHKKCTVVRHEIISFKDTHISRSALKTLGKYYLKHRFDKPVRGFGVVHYSDAPHIHFLMLGTAMDYSSTRIDRASFKAFKVKFQECQMAQFPELTSIVDHRSKPRPRLKLTQKEQHMAKARGVASDKAKLASTVIELAHSSKSFETLAIQLKAHNIEPYYRNGTLTGVWLNGKKYRMTTLGVNKSHLKELSLEQQRLDTLNRISDKSSRERGLER